MGHRKVSRRFFGSSRGIELLTPEAAPLRRPVRRPHYRGNPAGNPVRLSLLLVMASLLIGTSSASSQDDADTTALCPAIDFTGFSTGAGNARVEETLRWDAARRSYLVQGPELAQRFLYPDPKRTLAQLKSDPAHVYELPVDRTVSVLDQDICRPKIEISGRCEIAAVPGAASQPAYVFTADLSGRLRSEAGSGCGARRTADGRRADRHFSSLSSMRFGRFMIPGWTSTRAKTSSTRAIASSESAWLHAERARSVAALPASRGACPCQARRSPTLGPLRA